MKNIKYITLTLLGLIAVQFAFSQTYKYGQKAEALINNKWIEVTVLKLVSGKTDVYNVQSVTPTGATTSVIANYQVKEQDLRGAKKAELGTGANATTGGATAETANAAVAKDAPSALLGTYNIYAGIQNLYIGHFQLLEGGNYKVALASDEDSYANGTYTYDAASNTITWKTGFFWQKKWDGKINKGRIQFSNTTYATVK